MEYRGAAHSICSLKYSVPKKINIAFHSGSDNDYHFIIKELAKELEKNVTCLGENTEKYITFSVPIEKEVSISKKNSKNGDEITKKTYYRLQFIDKIYGKLIIKSGQ